MAKKLTPRQRASVTIGCLALVGFWALLFLARRVIEDLPGLQWLNDVLPIVGIAGTVGVIYLAGILEGPKSGPAAPVQPEVYSDHS